MKQKDMKQQSHVHFLLKQDFLATSESHHAQHKCVFFQQFFDPPFGRAILVRGHQNPT